MMKGCEKSRQSLLDGLVQIIIIILFASASLAFFNNEKNLIRYSKLLCFIIPLLFFFLDLAKEYDLYRHYENFEILKKMTFKQLFSMNNIFSSSLIEEPVYVVLIWGLTRLKIKYLLPYIVGVVVYFSAVYILSDCKKRYNISNRAYYISVLMLFLLTDFIGITGIRNILCASLFCLLLYLELVCRKNKCIIFALYLTLCFIHSATVVFLLIRIIMFIHGKVSQWLLGISALLVFSIFPLIYEQYGSQLSSIPMLKNAMWLFYKYTNGYTGGHELLGMRIICVIMYMLGLLLYLIVSKDIDEDKGIVQFVDCVLLFICFSIGSYNQYDLFVRSSFICIPMITILNELYLKYRTNGNRIMLLKGRSIFESGYCIFLHLFGLLTLIMVAVYRFTYQYLPCTEYFSL